MAAFQAKVRAGITRAVDMKGGVPPTYLAYTVAEYDLLPGADRQGRPYVRARRFEPALLPLFLEGPVHALKVQPTMAEARRLYAAVRAGDLYDAKLGMYKVNASLRDQPHEIGRARAFTPGWLENESIWLHMEYKYLLEVLNAHLYEEFYEDFSRALICFQDPAVYGRSPLENSSFLVSSAHPDASLHGAGFVARLSGATAEFLSIWTTMMAGRRPFFLQDGELCLALRPVLPAWLFDAKNKLAFTFLGHSPVTVHNPRRVDTWRDESANRLAVLHLPGRDPLHFPGGIIPAPYAAMVRAGQATAIDLFLP